jgi:hypothetical protein
MGVQFGLFIQAGINHISEVRKNWERIEMTLSQLEGVSYTTQNGTLRIGCMSIDKSLELACPINQKFNDISCELCLYSLGEEEKNSVCMAMPEFNFSDMGVIGVIGKEMIAGVSRSVYKLKYLEGVLVRAKKVFTVDSKTPVIEALQNSILHWVENTENLRRYLGEPFSNSYPLHGQITFRDSLQKTISYRARECSLCTWVCEVNGDLADLACHKNNGVVCPWEIITGKTCVSDEGIWSKFFRSIERSTVLVAESVQYAQEIVDHLQRTLRFVVALENLWEETWRLY